MFGILKGILDQEVVVPGIVRVKKRKEVLLLLTPLFLLLFLLQETKNSITKSSVLVFTLSMVGNS